MYTTGTALLLKTAQQTFWNSYFEYDNPFEGLVYQKESTQLVETYAHLGSAPMPEQWEADDNVKVMNEYSYTVKNIFWKSAVRFAKSLVHFQQWDVIADAVANMGTKARAHQSKRLTEFLLAAHATAGADGQFYFDTDHAWSGAEYSTAWDNDLTANITPTAPTLAELATAIRAIIGKLYTSRDDRGDPRFPTTVNPANIIIHYPSAYVNLFNQLLTQDSITNPGDNDLKGRFTARINPFLPDPTSSQGLLFGFLAGSNRKPLILQQAGPIVFGNNLQGDEYRSTGNSVFDAWWCGEAAPGDHALAVRYEFT